jgi:15-cis-phytoene desaturase
LLERVGASADLSWQDLVYTYPAKGGHTAEVRPLRLPPPLHLLVAVARYGHLGWLDRLSALLPTTLALVTSARYRDTLDSITYSRWASRLGARQRLIDYTVAPAARGLTFLDPDEVSAKVLVDWLHHFMRTRETSRLALFRRGMSDSVIQPIVDYLLARGGTLRTSAKVAGMELEGGRIASLRLLDGTTLTADAYVIAAPVHEVVQLLPAGVFEQPYFSSLQKIRPVPVIAAQVWLNATMFADPGVMFSPDCAFSVYADVSHVRTDLGSHQGSLLELVLSPARDLVQRSDEELSALVTRELAEVHGVATAARVRKCAFVRLPKSFHGAYPGTEALRPSQRTPVANLFLAGDYTRTGYGPSMEGAVSSGFLAAASVLNTQRGRLPF